MRIRRHTVRVPEQRSRLLRNLYGEIVRRVIVIAAMWVGDSFLAGILERKMEKKENRYNMELFMAMPSQVICIPAHSFAMIIINTIVRDSKKKNNVKVFIKAISTSGA